MDYNREYFSGKTAVVTGAASGIGLALVEELLESNAAKVVMADINPDRLSEHENRLGRQYGGKVKGLLCDVTAEEQVQRLIVDSATFFGERFDLLFNNAGAGFAGRFIEHDNAEWKAAFDLNFYSALYGMRAVLPIMLEQGGGQIVNIISGISFMPMPYQTRYSATKCALNGLSLALRAEYWDDNIKISSATPGTTATNIFGDLQIPEDAQSPHQSARRILHGVVNNDRLIFGSDDDARGGAQGYNVFAQKEIDQHMLRVARARREGKNVY